MRTPLERARDAHGQIGLALNLCKGASLDDLARASDFLRAAATELHSLQSDFSSTGIADPDGQFRAEMALLKRDMAAAGRIIDAGSALHHGLAVRIAGTAMAYSPHGSKRVATPAPASLEIEG